MSLDTKLGGRDWFVELVERRVKQRIKRRNRFLFSVLFVACVIGGAMFGMWHLAEAQVLVYESRPVELLPQAETVLARITGYSSSVDETDDTPFITASGSTVGQGTIACPSKYAFGTQVIILGREYTCEDRMNKRYRHLQHFDIWFESKDEALQWGVKDLAIKILVQNE